MIAAAMADNAMNVVGFMTQHAMQRVCHAEAVGLEALVSTRYKEVSSNQVAARLVRKDYHCG
jgi:hypothetical protein